MWASLQSGCALVAFLQATWCILLPPSLPLLDSSPAIHQRLPAQLCWSLLLAPLLSAQGIIFGSTAFRSLAARRAWAVAARYHLRRHPSRVPTVLGGLASVPPVPHAASLASIRLLRRVRRRRRRRNLALGVGRSLRFISPLVPPLADVAFGVAAALLPGVRLMGILYLASLFLHLLARGSRPPAWHNALRQAVLTLELLSWAVQSLVTDVYRGATGGSLSFAQVAEQLCRLVPGLCESAGSFFMTNAFWSPRSLSALAILSVVSSRVSRLSAEGAHAKPRRQGRTRHSEADIAFYSSDSAGRTSSSSSDDTGHGAGRYFVSPPRPGDGTSWTGLAATVALYACCIVSAYTGEADAIRAVLLLSTIACTFGGRTLDPRAVDSGQQAHTANTWRLPHSTLLCHLWLPAGMISALELVFVYALELGSLGIGGMQATAVGDRNSTVDGGWAVSADQPRFRGASNGQSSGVIRLGLGLSVADLRWFSASAELDTTSRSVWELMAAMRAPLALHLLAIAQQVRDHA